MQSWSVPNRVFEHPKMCLQEEWDKISHETINRLVTYYKWCEKERWNYKEVKALLSQLYLECGKWRILINEMKLTRQSMNKARIHTCIACIEIKFQVNARTMLGVFVCIFPAVPTFSFGFVARNETNEMMGLSYFCAFAHWLKSIHCCKRGSSEAECQGCYLYLFSLRCFFSPLFIFFSLLTLLSFALSSSCLAEKVEWAIRRAGPALLRYLFVSNSLCRRGESPSTLCWQDHWAVGAICPTMPHLYQKIVCSGEREGERGEGERCWPSRSCYL